MCRLAADIIKGKIEAVTLVFGDYQPVSKKPNEAGIYCIYRADNGGRPKELLYVGETGNLESPITDICKDWNEKNEPVYCLAPMKNGKDELLRAKSALIYKFKPERNEKGKDSFNYGKMSVLITGGKFPCSMFIIGK